MVFNYIKLSLRLMARNPFFTFINVIGLAIGFTSFYALWEYSTLELKSDDYHIDADRIGRIGINWDYTDDGGKNWGHVTLSFATTQLLPAVKEDFSEVESTLRILPQWAFDDHLVGHRDKVNVTVESTNGQKKLFKEEHIVYADSSLFSFFSIPLIYGRPSQVLREANYVTLSQSTAEKYFGKQDPTGELIVLNDSVSLYVAGVFQDLPHYSHLNFDLAISNLGHLAQWNSWFMPNTTSYVKLKHADMTDFENKLNRKIEVYLGNIMRANPNTKLSMYVKPLREVPFELLVGDYFSAKSKPFLLLLSFIGISVLVMAWINYVNITVSRSARRMKEIATRRVCGARSGDMLGQFMTEALVTNLVAMGLAFTFLQLIKQPAASMFNIQIDPVSSLNATSLGIIITIILSGILLTGMYPAIISMAYKPRAILRINEVSSGRLFIPTVLTISQITAAIIFMTLGLLISLQLEHILNKDIGIRKDQAIVLEGPVVKPTSYVSSLESFKKELAGVRGMESISLSKFYVNRLSGAQFTTKRLGAELFFGMDDNCVDEDFIPFHGLKIIAGRNFVKDDQPNAIIVNRFAAEKLGFSDPEEAVGATINIRILFGPWHEAHIAGVVANFRNLSYLNMTANFTDTNRGVVLLNNKQDFSDFYNNPDLISFRVNGQAFDGALDDVKKLFNQHFPGALFTWAFLDDKLNEIYAQEKIARNQVVLFTVLAIIIACLGLLGMITNRVTEKVKEIGIRKILGAQLHQIAQILLNTTVKQVIVATVIGIPVAYYLTQQYLEKFSERVGLQWWHFALPVVILVAILLGTIMTVLWQAVKTNPVEALKYE